MTPIPWPLIGRAARRRELLAALTADAIDAGTYGQPAPAELDDVVVTIRPDDTRYRDAVENLQAAAHPPLPATADDEHAVMRRACAWLRREEDVVLPRLARLTDRTDPWTAATRLFADTEENP